MASRLVEVDCAFGAVLELGSGELLPAINAESDVLACQALRLVCDEGDRSLDRLEAVFCISCNSEVTEDDSVRRWASLEEVDGPLLDSDRGLNAVLDVAKAPPVMERVIDVAAGEGWFADWVDGCEASEGVSAAVVVVVLGEFIRLRRGVESLAILSEIVGAGVIISERRTGLLEGVVGLFLAVAAPGAAGDGVDCDSERAEVSAGCREDLATGSAATGGGFLLAAAVDSATR